MKVKILIDETKTGAQVAERIAEILQHGELVREVSVAVEDARKQVLDPFRWSLHVYKA